MHPKFKVSNKHLVCAVCSKKHDLDFCPTFKSKEPERKKQIDIEEQIVLWLLWS